jgi:hypothetical protein
MEQLDFDHLNDSLRNAFECKTEGCSRRVAGYDNLCYRCFAGLMTGEVIKEGGHYLKDPNWKPKKGRKK